MKRILIAALIVMNLSSFAQDKPCAIFFDTIYDTLDLETKYLAITTSKFPKDTTFITVYQEVGDCSGESFSFGKVIFSNDTITHYSYDNGYDRMKLISSYGASKYNYLYDSKKCKIKKLDHKIFIYQDLPGTEGADGLYQKPKTKEEKEAFKKYIKDIEESSGAKFVFGNQSDELFKEVKHQLKKEIDQFFDEMKGDTNIFSTIISRKFKVNFKE